MRRLVYRYWMHVLTEESVVFEPHPSFVSWAAKDNALYMYTSKQLKSWSPAHLKLCHWYINMDPRATSAHEEENRRSVEPEFVAASDPTPLFDARPEKSVRGSRSKSKKASKDVSGGSKVGKRGATGASKRPSKRGKVSYRDAPQEVPTENVSESDVKSEAKSDLAPAMTFAFANISVPRMDLVQRCDPGSFVTRILNQSISEFLKQPDRSDFDTPVIQVSHWVIELMVASCSG